MQFVAGKARFRETPDGARRTEPLYFPVGGGSTTPSPSTSVKNARA